MVTHFENMDVAGTLASVKGIHDGVNNGLMAKPQLEATWILSSSPQ